MNHVQIRLFNESPHSRKVVKNAIAKLDARKHQVSLETQQLSSVGMMPDPSYQVVDVSKMSIAQAVRLFEEAKTSIDHKSKYVLVKNDDHETIQERIDRETIVRSLKDLGADVFESDSEMAKDIQDKYQEIGIKVSESTNV